MERMELGSTVRFRGISSRTKKMSSKLQKLRGEPSDTRFAALDAWSSVRIGEMVMEDDESYCSVGLP